MQEGCPGVFSHRKNPYIEVHAKKTEKYHTFALKAARSCRLNVKERQKLALFKLNGARILDETISVKGNEKPWTIGNYLLMMKKTASGLKIRVGCVDINEDVSDE